MLSENFQVCRMVKARELVVLKSWVLIAWSQMMLYLSSKSWLGPGQRKINHGPPGRSSSSREGGLTLSEAVNRLQHK